VTARRLLGVALAAALVSAWAAATAVYVWQVAHDRLAWVGVHVDAAPAADGYPTVRSLWPGTAAETSGLAPGDRLLRVGDLDLRGVGRVGFVARTLEAAGAAGAVPVAFERAGRAGETTLGLTPVGFPWRTLPLTLALVVTGVLVLLRRPGDAGSRAFFLAATVFSIHWTFFFGGPRAFTWAWAVVFALASLVAFPLVLRAAMLFPAEAAVRGRLPAWPWAFAVFGPISTSWVFGVPLPPAIGLRGAFVVNVVFIATLLAVLTRNYHRSGAIGRRQVRWVLIGFYLGTVPVAFTDVVAGFAPGLWWLHDVGMIAEVAIPICCFIAIDRFNLFDVDRLITATAVYTILSVTLVAAGLMVLPGAAAAGSAAVGIPAAQGQVALSLVLAMALVPAERWLRPRVERLIFAERHALEQGVARLLPELAVCPEPGALLTLVADRLVALLSPAGCVVYGPVAEGWAPLVARGFRPGTPEPPPLAAGGGLVTALAAQGAPLDVDRWRRRGGRAGPDAMALDRLGTAVALPVRRGDVLEAVVCLGRKRSGDVYTSTDRALLAAVADKVSAELLRFDASEILRRTETLRDALRRYVPEPVAARLARGEEMEGGTRQASVLFVDVRGFTTYSAGREVEVVFSAISRHTEMISEAIARHGGIVVEFLGDGVMAVFGAPEPAPEPAREAVAAAREIVVSARRLDGGEAAGAAVGVGIATGPVFVGNIRTSDRLIYTALGDTVNLASRLQALTRELAAAIAIDGATFGEAGEGAAPFEARGPVPIRGRREAVEVWVLPL
jgi:class 3 adenylate cyclase